MKQDDFIFETKDYQGTTVYLSKNTWNIKAGADKLGSHPEIDAYIYDIKFTIETPDLVFQSQRDTRSRLFYSLNVGRGDFLGKHLVVVIKYIEEKIGLKGYVSTMYLSRSIYSKGVLLWSNKKLQIQ